MTFGDPGSDHQAGCGWRMLEASYHRTSFNINILEYHRSFRYGSVTAPLQLRCTSIIQLRYSFRYSSVIQLRYSSGPLCQVRYSSATVQLLFLLRLRYSFRYSTAAAGSAALQPSDTAPLHLRGESVTAPLLSVTVSISPVADTQP